MWDELISESRQILLLINFNIFITGLSGYFIGSDRETKLFIGDPFKKFDVVYV